MKNILIIIISTIFLSGCASTTVGFITGAIKVEMKCYKEHGDNSTKRRLCLAKNYITYKIKKDFTNKQRSLGK